MTVLAILLFVLAYFVFAAATSRLYQAVTSPFDTWGEFATVFLCWPLILVALAFVGLALIAAIAAGVRDQ